MFYPESFEYIDRYRFSQFGFEEYNHISLLLRLHNCHLYKHQDFLEAQEAEAYEHYLR